MSCAAELLTGPPPDTHPSPSALRALSHIAAIDTQITAHMSAAQQLFKDAVAFAQHHLAQGSLQGSSATLPLADCEATFKSLLYRAVDVELPAVEASFNLITMEHWVALGFPEDRCRAEVEAWRVDHVWNVGLFERRRGELEGWFAGVREGWERDGAARELGRERRG